jgi:hypothetical protein
VWGVGNEIGYMPNPNRGTTIIDINKGRIEEQD